MRPPAGLPLSTYVRRELESLAKSAHVAKANMAVVRRANRFFGTWQP